jgi:hypothetical protein
MLQSVLDDARSAIDEARARAVQSIALESGSHFVHGLCTQLATLHTASLALDAIPVDPDPKPEPTPEPTPEPVVKPTAKTPAKPSPPPVTKPVTKRGKR